MEDDLISIEWNTTSEKYNATKNNGCVTAPDNLVISVITQFSSSMKKVENCCVIDFIAILSQWIWQYYANLKSFTIYNFVLNKLTSF